MAPRNSRESEPADIRATFEEYTVGASRVGTIADPENAHAWIQSTLTVDIEQ